jgi:hypothetical protein
MDLGTVLMRIALSSNTPSALAVLRSLLAFSSIHRDGVVGQALDLKISSLTTLAAAWKGNLSTEELIQHVAAGMLLCSFEVDTSLLSLSLLLDLTGLGSPVIMYLKPMDVVHPWSQERPGRSLLRSG